MVGADNGQRGGGLGSARLFPNARARNQHPPAHLLLEPLGGLVPPERHEEPEHEEEHRVEAPQGRPDGRPGDVDPLVRLQAEQDCRSSRVGCEETVGV